MSDVVRCPRCMRELGALARFCHDCGDYVADLAGESTDGSAKRSSSSPAAPGDPLEVDIRMDIRGLLELFGFVVLDFEQGYRADGTTRVEKGLADLYIMGYGVGVWRELKRPGNAPTKDQLAFAAKCARSGISWDWWDSIDEARTWAEATRPNARRKSVGDSDRNDGPSL